VKCLLILNTPLIHAALPSAGIFFIHGLSRNMHPSGEDGHSIGMLSAGRYWSGMGTDARYAENSVIFQCII